MAGAAGAAGRYEGAGADGAAGRYEAAGAAGATDRYWTAGSTDLYVAAGSTDLYGTAAGAFDRGADCEPRQPLAGWADCEPRQPDEPAPGDPTTCEDGGTRWMGGATP